MSTINERVQLLIDTFYNGSQKDFASAVGTSTSVINGIVGKRGSSPSFEVLSKIYATVDISADWLISGNGDFNASTNIIQTQRLYQPKYQESIIEEQAIPYYSIEATAGVLEHLDNSVEYQIGQIMIPNMPRCDGAVSITGDSMYPLLKSGDIVAFQVVHDINNIHFGDMYLVSINEDGDTYITVKWVKKHPSDPEKAVLESHNPNYSPRDVLLKHIHKIALIKFSIRYNSMG
ncbi:S24 family peptidase [Porphyromonadaceae bacterium W3.11]|nr:S24 family peptidase [Porphyromonadaceae bacterium W3.11]